MDRKEPVALLAALLASAALAQHQRPLPPGAPDPLVAASLRVHVVVHEDLDPDLIRNLARPGVTLWLQTRSNTLRESTIENVARFDEAFVELRAPLKAVDAQVLARAPRAGAWVRAKELEALSGRLPGARRVAVRVDGALDEALAERLTKARPSFISWRPGEGGVDLLHWGLFAQLPGRRVLVAPAGMLLPVKCDARANEPALELHVATLLAMSSDVFPCGKGTRVIVPPTADRWLLQSLLVRDASLELVLELGADANAASKARVLLETLGAGAAR